MKKLLFSLGFISLSLVSISSCSEEKNIIVGATPSPHAEILSSDAVQDYVESRGYTLTVKTYQDYVTPNKALNDEALDANYFQHIAYMNQEKSDYGYDIEAVCNVHYEPLNLYSKTEITSYDGLTINIINDISNVERALALLKYYGVIDDYTIDGFNASYPQDYITATTHNVTINCIAEGLLASSVDDGGVAVIPGNFALTAWGAEVCSSYTRLSESAEVAGQSANIICVRSDDVNSEKTQILIDTFAQESVKEFIEQTYGSTVVYYYSSLI